MADHDRIRHADAQLIGESDRTDEELAEYLRAQTAVVSDFGDDIAAGIERGTVESGTLTRELLRLSNLLVEIANTVDRTGE